MDEVKEKEGNIGRGERGEISKRDERGKKLMRGRKGIWQN